MTAQPNKATTPQGQLTQEADKLLLSVVGAGAIAKVCLLLHYLPKRAQFLLLGDRTTQVGKIYMLRRSKSRRVALAIGKIFKSYGSQV